MSEWGGGGCKQGTASRAWLQNMTTMQTMATYPLVGPHGVFKLSYGSACSCTPQVGFGIGGIHADGCICVLQGLSRGVQLQMNCSPAHQPSGLPFGFSHRSFMHQLTWLGGLDMIAVSVCCMVCAALSAQMHRHPGLKSVLQDERYHQEQQRDRFYSKAAEERHPQHEVCACNLAHTCVSAFPVACTS